MCRSCAACSGPGEFSQHVGTENRRPGIPLIQMLPIEIAKLDPHIQTLIELDDGKIYKKALYLMVKTMVSCRFSLKPIHSDTFSDTQGPVVSVITLYTSAEP